MYSTGGHSVSECAILDFIYVIDLDGLLLYVEVYFHKEKHTVDISSH